MSPYTSEISLSSRVYQNVYGYWVLLLHVIACACDCLGLKSETLSWVHRTNVRMHVLLLAATAPH